MKRMLVFASIVVASALNLAVMPVPVQADSVSIGVNIGSPPPVIVSTAPPPLVVVPGSPVYYAPSLNVNYFAYGGRYYSHHNGAWFLAMTYNGPWGYIAVGQVPQPVLAVPVAYYKVPPGHMKKGGARRPGPATARGPSTRGPSTSGMTNEDGCIQAVREGGGSRHIGGSLQSRSHDLRKDALAYFCPII